MLLGESQRVQGSTRIQDRMTRSVSARNPARLEAATLPQRMRPTGLISVLLEDSTRRERVPHPHVLETLRNVGKENGAAQRTRGYHR